MQLIVQAYIERAVLRGQVLYSAQIGLVPSITSVQVSVIVCTLLEIRLIVGGSLIILMVLWSTRHAKVTVAELSALGTMMSFNQKQLICYLELMLKHSDSYQGVLNSVY